MNRNEMCATNRLVSDILLTCGNSSPTPKQHWLISELLSYATVNPHAKKIENLSDRERTCLFWIAQGKNVKQIGDLMGIQKSTVITYRQRIRTKLGCKSLTHAVFISMCYKPVGQDFLNLLSKP